MPNYQNNSRNYSRRSMNMPMPLPHTCCDSRNDILDGLPVAMAYVPWQEWKCPYDMEKGLHCGTIFEDLFKPFLGKEGCIR